MGKDFDIEKLKGNENYHTWCFAVSNVLAYKGLEKCIVEGDDTEKNAEKMKNSKAILALSVETSIFVHIERCQTALEIWSTLKRIDQKNWRASHCCSRATRGL